MGISNRSNLKSNSWFFSCSLVNLSSQSMILHSLQCSRQKLQSHYSFVSILHSSFIIYQHLSFQPPKCNQCPLLPNFTAATFFKIPLLYLVCELQQLQPLFLAQTASTSASNLPHSRSYLYSFKPFSLLKVLKYNIHTVKSFKNRNYFISLYLKLFDCFLLPWEKNQTP